MKKNTDRDETVNSEGITNPELLFSDDAQLVDYLNALLASDPDLNSDFREIHFVHQAKSTGWKSADAANTVVGNAIMLETEFLKAEADALRNENENLKFKTELATIDAQVLRGENSNLKEKIAHLTANLNEMEYKLSSTLAQNYELKANIEVNKALSLLNKPIIDIKSTEPYTDSDSTPHVEETAEEEFHTDPEHVVPLDIVDTVIEQEDKPVLDAAVIPQSSTACEISKHVSQEPEIVVQKYRMDDERPSATDPDRSMISLLHNPNEFGNKNSKSDVSIFSRKSVVEKMTIQSDKPVSKIIKQQHAEKRSDTRQNSPALQVSYIGNAPPDNNNEIILSPDSVKQQPVAEIENKNEDAPSSDMVNQSLDGTVGIDLAQTPAPKNIVRRNVKNYEDLQKESDSTISSATGHTIVL